MNARSQKFIRISRLILTCLVLFLITWYYKLPEREWSLITIWFVMSEYTTVGGVLKKSAYRFSGTALSAIYGMIIIYCFDNNVIMNIVAMAAGVFFYMHYFLEGEKTYVGVIGSVTLTIVLLNHNDLDAALLRTFNIMIGILASVFMIRFFYPSYARDTVIQEQLYFVDQFITQLTTYLDDRNSVETIQHQTQSIEQNLLIHFTAFNRHLDEARIEMNHPDDFIAHNQQALQNVRHLFRLFNVFIQYLTVESLHTSPVSPSKAKDLPACARDDERTVTINQQLMQIVNLLKHTKQLLQRYDIITPCPAAVKSSNAEHDLVFTLLKTMEQEIVQLNTHINQIMQIYTQSTSVVTRPSERTT